MRFTIDKLLKRAFYKWGLFIYKFRYIFLIIPLLITGGLGWGFQKLNEVRVVKPETVFAPTNGANKYELKVLQEQFPLDQERYIPGKQLFLDHWVEIVILPFEHSENMLNPLYMEAASMINQWIMDQLIVEVEDVNTNQTIPLTYRALCLRWEWKCYENDHLILVKDHSQEWSKYKNDWAQDMVKSVIENEVQLTWPNASSGGNPLYIGSVLGGARLIDSKGHFNYLKGVRLVYSLRQGELIDQYSDAWTHKLTEMIISGKMFDELSMPPDLLDVSLFHTTSIEDGLVQVAHYVTPNMGLSYLLLTIFALIFTTKSDARRSKPYLALTSVFCSAMGVVSAIGGLILCSFPYSDVVLTMPFLMFAIGVDDMFILVSAWHRSNPSQPTRIRLAETLSDAAVSVTITSITDMLSFAIGTYSELPVVQMFCAYCAAGIFFTFVYQLTFFVCVMAICGDWEQQNRHCIMPCITLPEKNSGCSSFLCTSSGKDIVKPGDEDSSEGSLVSLFIREYYGPMLKKPLFQVAAGIMYIAYLAVAIYGIMHMQEGLNLGRLVLQDHYLTKYYKLMNEAFWDEGSQAHVVINNPGNLADPGQRELIMEMVEAFEGTKHTMKRNATMFWMIFYDQYLEENDRQWENTTRKVEEKIRDWLRFTQGRRSWLSDSHWIEEDDGHESLLAFRLQVGLTHFNTPNDHRETAVLLRSIASRFPTLNVTTYHQFYPFADQYLVIRPSTIRNMAICVTCMILVAMALIPSIPCALLTALAVISIDVGVLGFMTHWDVSLDCVSMITIIMCIGFAVDLSAHICYAYVSCGNVVTALENLGWPVLLGAFSTVLGMAALVTVDAYLVSTFFKTVLLVIVFGIMHSLVFLPIALFLLIKIPCCSSSKDSVYDLDKAHRNFDSKPKDLPL